MSNKENNEDNKNLATFGRKEYIVCRLFNQSKQPTPIHHSPLLSMQKPHIGMGHKMPHPNNGKGRQGNRK